MSNHIAELFGEVITGLIPSRRDVIIGLTISLTIFALAIYGLLHLVGLV